MRSSTTPATCVYEPIEKVTEETLDKMIASGLKSSVFWGVQAYLEHRDSNAVRGDIINYRRRSPIAVGPTRRPIPRSRAQSPL